MKTPVISSFHLFERLEQTPFNWYIDEPIKIDLRVSPLARACDRGRGLHHCGLLPVLRLLPYGSLLRIWAKTLKSGLSTRISIVSMVLVCFVIKE